MADALYRLKKALAAVNLSLQGTLHQPVLTQHLWLWLTQKWLCSACGLATLLELRE
jgi:hypothetical protein